MQENNTAKWYVIHTYSGYEAMVQSSLEKLIENNNLSDTILDIKIPMEQTIEEKNGKKKVVLRKLIPSYVFIKMIFNNDLWYVITNIKGVTGFVGPQGRLLPLTEDEVKRMGLETKVEIEQSQAYSGRFSQELNTTQFSWLCIVDLKGKKCS